MFRNKIDAYFTITPVHKTMHIFILAIQHFAPYHNYVVIHDGIQDMSYINKFEIVNQNIQSFR